MFKLKSSVLYKIFHTFTVSNMESKASDCICRQLKALLPPGFQPLFVSPVPSELWIVPASDIRRKDNTITSTKKRVKAFIEDIYKDSIIKKIEIFRFWNFMKRYVSLLLSIIFHSWTFYQRNPKIFAFICVEVFLFLFSSKLQEKIIDIIFL